MVELNLRVFSNLGILISASVMFGAALFLIWQAPRARLNQLMTMWAVTVSLVLFSQLGGALYEQLNLDIEAVAVGLVIAWLISTELNVYLLFVSLVLYTKPWSPRVRFYVIGMATAFLPLLIYNNLSLINGSPYEFTFDSVSGVPLLTRFLADAVSASNEGMSLAGILATAYIMLLTFILPFVVWQKETHRYIKYGVVGICVAVTVIQIPPFVQTGFASVAIILPDLCIVYAILDDQVFAPLRQTTEELQESKYSLEVAYKTVEREVNQQTLELVESLMREQELSQRLEDALTHEEQLSQLKSLIIDNVFHEFRTPLTIINNSAEMLNRFGAKLDDEKRKKYFQRISDQIFYIDDLLKDILLASQANSKGIQPQWQKLPFNELCSESMILWQSEYARDGQIMFEFDPTDGRLVNIDRRLFERIGFNLLSNAIKYSAPNPVVTVSLMLTDVVTLQVIDNGIGILPDDQERIFELFERGRNVETRRGMGLGLYTARQMAQALEGNISVKSAGANRGSIFTMVLPITTHAKFVSPRVHT